MSVKTQYTYIWLITHASYSLKQVWTRIKGWNKKKLSTKPKKIKLFTIDRYQTA